MKLCPQCAFIYEDDQRFCDMDGKVLVCDPAAVVSAPLVTEQRVVLPTRLTINIPVRSQSKRFPVLIISGVVLATLLSAIYFAQSLQSQSNDTDWSSIRSSERSAAGDTSSKTSSPSSAIAVETSPSAQSAEHSDQRSKESLSSPTNVAALNADSSLRDLRQTSNPVSAGGLTGNSRSPVIVRLTNGATIKADEAWERREGVWYRQGGMVTFLKRGRVRTIERPSHSLLKAAANNVEERNRKSNSVGAQNQLRIRKLEPADTKKQSRVKSFLKKTTRMLKKPFTF